MVRTRLDRLLVTRGLVATRSRARDLIVRGQVRIDGATARKPGLEIREDADISLADGVSAYVSRGATKLAAALAHFGYEASGVAVLDIGASTGGFTQVLLEAGARQVYAIDVGREQLDPGLQQNCRVVSFEGTDARSLSVAHIPEPAGAIVADVSFVSLTKVLPVPLSLTAREAWLVALIKPQFEAGREAVGRGGIVRDPSDRQRAVDSVRDWLARQPGWVVDGVIESPILGGAGNQEFLIGARRND